MKLLKSLIFISFLLPMRVLAAGDFNFDWDDKNDMRGAWLMCATTAFIGGDCPKVLIKCWQPPLLYIDCDGGGCSTKTECMKPPVFNWAPTDLNDVIDTM